MRHVRLLLLVVLFVLMPAKLLLVGVDVWLGVVEERRHDEDFEAMSRHLRELRDDASGRRDSLRLAREARDRLAALPALDEAAVRAVKADFGARYPGLLTLHVFAAGKGTAETPLLVDGSGARFRFALQTLADHLWQFTHTETSSVSLDRLKIIRQVLLGRSITARFLEKRDDQIIDAESGRRPVGLFWDILETAPVAAGAPPRPLGMLIAFVDTKAAGETHFPFQRLLERERRRAAPAGISLEPLDLGKPDARTRLAGDDPALAGRLARFPIQELRSVGAESLHVILPVRHADQFALYAGKTRADSFPWRDAYAIGARAFTTGVVLLFSFLLLLRHTGRIPLFLPVRIQLGALFVLAALVPYGILVYAGMDQILGSRRQLVKEAEQRINQRIEAIESEQETRMLDLYALALSLHEREVTAGFKAWSAARAAAIPPGTTGEVTAFSDPYFAALRARIDACYRDGLNFNAFVFDADGETLYRHDKPDSINRHEDNLLATIALTTIAFVNTGELSVPAVKRVNPIVAQVIANAVEKGHDESGLIYASRTTLHRVDFMGFKCHVFVEAILDADRKAVGATVIPFLVERILYFALARTMKLNWADPREEIKLATRYRSDHMDAITMRDRAGPEMYDFLGRIREDKAPRSARLVVGGEPVYAFGRMLVRDDPFAVAGFVPARSVNAAFRDRIALFAAIVFAGFIFSIALGLWIAGRIVRSIRILSDGVQRVEAGGAGARIALESPDEFGTLASSFNTMSVNLAQAMHRLERRILEITTLYSVNQSIAFTRSWNETLRVILEKAVESLEVEKGSLMLWNEAEARLETAVVAGLDGPVERRIGLAAGEGLAGRVFVTGASEVIADAANDARFFRSEATADSDARTRNLLCVPLKLKERVLGVINLTNKRGERGFGLDDLSLVEALATQAAVTIENARLYDLSITDGMTGLYINRYFQVRMDEELKRAARYGTCVSLLFTDVDHFKNFNDTWGHQTGDRVLIQVARAMRRAIRDVDIPCRYGGEEFAVIAPNTDAEGVKTVAERLRRMIEEEPIAGPAGEPLTITVSVGVATFPHDAADKGALVEAADAALYHAKRTGRNRWVRYRDIPPGERPGGEPR